MRPDLAGWRRRPVSGGALTLAAGLLGATVTALILGTPLLGFGVRSPSLHLVLDTVDACVAVLVAYLLYGRYSRDRRRQDALLAQAMVLLAVAGGGLMLALRSSSGASDGTLEIWLPLTVRLAGAGWLAAAAVTGAVAPEATVRGRSGSWWVSLAVVAAAGLLLWSLRDRLPVAVDTGYVPASAQHPVLAGHPLLLAAQAASAIAFGVAGVAFALQSTRKPDELIRWLGPACALGGFARLNYLLFPSLYTDWLYTGDVLRTGCYVVLLVGAARELRQYWTAQARAAVLDDRRRLARELHDGVLQELGFIRGESYRLPPDHPSTDRISAAAERGLDEARAAVNALGRPGAEPLGFALHRAVRELSERYPVRVEVDLDDSIAVPPGQQHDLVRITREAVSNAVRHGRAHSVQVRLGREEGARVLAIVDDGSGFDDDQVRAGPSGYGMTSMRERAELLPGALAVAPGPGGGSMVTVRW